MRSTCASRRDRSARCSGRPAAARRRCLRSIAGLVVPRSGDISDQGTPRQRHPIHQRNIGLVFQNYALFPHKNVFDNVAFGLKYA
jgi:putative spermidine/putrescine transport system ATP-binding protein